MIYKLILYYISSQWNREKLLSNHMWHDRRCLCLMSLKHISLVLCLRYYHAIIHSSEFSHLTRYLVSEALVAGLGSSAWKVEVSNIFGATEQTCKWGNMSLPAFPRAGIRVEIMSIGTGNTMVELSGGGEAGQGWMIQCFRQAGSTVKFYSLSFSRNTLV